MKNALAKIWRAITLIRNGLANFIFIIFVVVILFALFSTEEPSMPENAPLLIRIDGVLVDEFTYDPTIFDLLDETSQNLETRVRDVTHAINHAKDDARVTALILNLNGLQGGGMSKIEEVGQAILQFKQSGKEVIAFSDNYSQQQYFLASFADTIILNDMGTVALTGFGFYTSYFKEATEKLSVKFHLFKVGDYKDAAEPYVRNSMSDASREHNSQWISSLWQRFTGQIETQRDLDAGTIQTLADNIETMLEGSEQDFATLSLNAGLVDVVVSRTELKELLVERFGKAEDSEFFQHIPFAPYLNQIQPLLPAPENNIGLITATGIIIDGEAPAGQIGGESLSALIRQAAQDKSLKALIIRIDSGGGSAFASEVIRDELESARENGLPIYISMGSVAASGGYWIATAADEIWAQPTTITGSIGVWGLIPNISESLARLGINNDGFGTSKLADIYHIDRPMSDAAKLVFQTGVENIYKKFLIRVSEARGMSVSSVHDIAQGRVWTGARAQELGLVDNLGTLDDVIDAVKKNINAADANIKHITKPLTPYQQFILAILEQTHQWQPKIREAVFGKQITGLLDSLPAHTTLPLVTTKSKNLQIYAQCLECLHSP